MEAPGYLTGGVESIPCKELLSASAQPGCAVRLDEALPHHIPSSTEAWRPLWPALHPCTDHNTHVSFQGCWLSRAGQKGVTIIQQTWDTDLLEREWRQISQWGQRTRSQAFLGLGRRKQWARGIGSRHHLYLPGRGYPEGTECSSKELPVLAPWP